MSSEREKGRRPPTEVDGWMVGAGYVWFGVWSPPPHAPIVFRAIEVAAMEFIGRSDDRGNRLFRIVLRSGVQVIGSGFTRCEQPPDITGAVDVGALSLPPPGVSR